MPNPRRLEYVPLDDLKGHPDNPKDHDLDLLGQSFDRFGYVEPQVMDERTGQLIAGHGRMEKLKALRDAGEAPPEGIVARRDGTWLVPVARGWSSTDDLEARAYLVTSNRAVEAGGWRDDALGPLLDELRSDAERGLEGVGFNSLDVDALLATTIPPDEPIEPEPGREVQERAKPRDVWQLGAHRLIVGDCRDPEVVARLLDGAAVNVAFTSPPYADRREYDAASGFVPIPPDEYVGWFEPIAANVATHLAPDGSWFVNIKPGAHGLDTDLYVLDLVLAHARRWGWHFLTEFCWERVGVPKSVKHRFKNQYEPIYQFTRGAPKVRPDNVRHVSNDSIAAFGPGRGNTSWADPESAVVSQGQRGDVFAGQRSTEPGYAFPGNRLPTFSGTHEATGHTAAFPVGLPAWFFRAYSDPGDFVFDPFMGSGSSLLAAEQEGRIGFGIELSPAYVDVVLDRWERHGGATPKRVDG